MSELFYSILLFYSIRITYHIFLLALQFTFITLRHFVKLRYISFTFTSRVFDLSQKSVKFRDKVI